MDATNDRATFVPQDLPFAPLPPCCLEDGLEPRRRFPRAELCVAGSALCGFLITSGLTMVILHYTLESREGFHSLAEHLRIATHVLGLSFVALAGALCLGTLFAYAVWKVSEVLEMAHRYREHRQFCGAYEDLRQSFRSQQSVDKAVGRYASGRFSSTTADSKEATPRK